MGRVVDGAVGVILETGLEIGLETGLDGAGLEVALGVIVAVGQGLNRDPKGLGLAIVVGVFGFVVGNGLDAFKAFAAFAERLAE